MSSPETTVRPHGVENAHRERVAGQPTLAEVIEEFNQLFDMSLRLPMWHEDLELAAEYADLRGRKDLAKKLRGAMEGAK